MKKILVILAFGLLCMGKAEASNPARGAKAVASINYTTTVSSVSTSGPGVVYSVILGTGTAGTDYVVLWDIASIGGTAIGTLTGLKAKIVVSSATQNTVVNFDPPLQFNNGIVAANSAGTVSTNIVYERGRVTNGY